MNPKIVQVGLDVHRTFSRLTARDAEGKVAWRGRLEHRDRWKLRADLRSSWDRAGAFRSVRGGGSGVLGCVGGSGGHHAADEWSGDVGRTPRAAGPGASDDCGGDASAPQTAWRDAGGRAVAVAAGDLVDSRVRHLGGSGQDRAVVAATRVRAEAVARMDRWADRKIQPWTGARTRSQASEWKEEEKTEEPSGRCGQASNNDDGHDGVNEATGP